MKRYFTCMSFFVVAPSKRSCHQALRDAGYTPIIFVSLLKFEWINFDALVDVLSHPGRYYQNY